MNARKKFAVQIAFVFEIIFILFSLLYVFLFGEVESFRDLWNKFFIQKELFGKDIFLLSGYFFGKVCLIAVGAYFMSYYLSGKIFGEIENNNTRLSKYNRYLAHELKTPISVIHGNLEILKHEIIPEKIQSSQEELQRMIRIVDGLLNYAESLKINEKGDINLENAIKKYVKISQGEKNIRIHNKEFNLSIHTDEVLFSRIIKNLIENALKYSSDGNLDIYLSKKKLRFENKILETLSSKDIKCLFESSYGKSFEEKKGHQIGLPMIQEIAKLLGYSLIISSENKKFIVELLFSDGK